MLFMFLCIEKHTHGMLFKIFVHVCERAVCVYIPVNMKKYFSRRQNLPKVLTSILMGYFCMINSFIRHCLLYCHFNAFPLALSLSFFFSLSSHSNVICLSHSFKITLIYIFASFHLIMYTIVWVSVCVCACGIFTYRIEVKGKPGR